VIVCGGGLAGSALGKALAERGARVLIVEREATFRDRVRGEGLHPWGVAEARALGLEERLLETCGQPIRWWNVHAGSTLQSCRDLIGTTPDHLGGLNFHHPEMQHVLLDLAQRAGAEIRRPAEVTAVAPGSPPEVVVRMNGTEQRLRARLVVGADGRISRVRQAAGFRLARDPLRLVIAGVLHSGLPLAEDAVHTVTDPSIGQAVLVFPVGRGRFRSYFVYRRYGIHRPLSGAEHAGEFVAACVETGVPAGWFEAARVIGPLAMFEGADRWVDHPSRDGIVLIGDAAAASDPCWGSGLALTLRDVRVLRDRLLATSDWDAAAAEYAREHDRYYGALHRLHGWMRELLYEVGPEADTRRARALPLLAKEPERRPDLLGLGPEAPGDEAARRRLFGED
jgi:2-polyprenyl-6-methoxyphenol hydroxylase-like FAD-dependent oxidoreductase